MEHIGNYLDKYRHMIAEHDAQRELNNMVIALEVAAIEQGKQIEELKKVCKDALEKLEVMKKQYESSK